MKKPMNSRPTNIIRPTTTPTPGLEVCPTSNAVLMDQARKISPAIPLITHMVPSLVGVVTHILYNKRTVYTILIFVYKKYTVAKYLEIPW